MKSGSSQRLKHGAEAVHQTRRFLAPEESLAVLVGMSINTNPEIDVLGPINVFGGKPLIATVFSSTPKRWLQLSENQKFLGQPIYRLT